MRFLAVTAAMLLPMADWQTQTLQVSVIEHQAILMIGQGATVPAWRQAASSASPKSLDQAASWCLSQCPALDAVIALV